MNWSPGRTRESWPGHRPPSAPSLVRLRVGLLAWVLSAGVALLLAPAAPPVPATLPEDTAIMQRTAAWAVRDAKAWQATHGDQTIPWTQAQGHLAIIVDDVGRELRWFEQLHDLRYRLTFSVLPGSVYAAGVQLRLRGDRRRPRDILLHLPSEPLEAAQMAQGAERDEAFLLRTDGDAVVAEKVRRAFERVPAAVGVNNHMGSALTADARAMASLMAQLRARAVFFVDSRTTAASVAEAAAKTAGVPFLSRAVFLDHSPDADAISAAIRAAAQRSRAEPTIAIVHPSATAVRLLREELPRLHEQGIGIYPVSEFFVRLNTLPAARI